MAELERPEQPNAEALRELVAEQYGKLVGYARKRLRGRGVPESSADAEDVVQESLRSVLAHTEPIENVRAYFYKVMDNEIKRAARHYFTGRRYASLDLDLREEEDGPVVHPAADAELRHVVGEVLGALPPQQRRVMLLTQGMGMTQAEAARVLKTSPGTVATYSHRAFVTLRVSLGALALSLLLWVVTVVTTWGQRPQKHEDGQENDPASWLEKVTEATGLSPLALGLSGLALLVSAAGLASYASVQAGQEPRNWWQRWGIRLRRVMQQSFGRREYDYSTDRDQSSNHFAGDHMDGGEQPRLFRE
ncbi:sigma-70 family RNA polymerase sigma factor [Streptomyces sp. RK23]|uniref:sigma-70 family RNA polymerase sigma factor n=1 Tax=unclassified Streptomyces TaxID=2593676 RepID=UPI001B37B337|nr:MULTISPECIES: sigma-70 family RNA polymerase sigma factor [unclassified Streptomyces]MBQ0967528.1 sigma-70 family RNA polymerase sigma factor [Streptomyces sp. RK74B]MBQ1008026.1 sigma-70 family RNA polymerase sigma factor [Streptomyces sp. RK23]